MEIVLRIVIAGLMVLLLVVGALLVARRRRALGQMARGIRGLDENRPSRAVAEHFMGSLGLLTQIFNQVVPKLEDRLRELQGSRRLLETVLEGMTEGVLAVDARRRLLFSNRAARDLFGLPDHGEGRLVAELVRRPQIQAVIETALRRSEPYLAEISVETARPARGRPGVLSLRVHATRLPGDDASGAVFVFHDVTELRRLERMRQDFVANASHELKTPLASIRAYAETLLEGAIQDDAVNVTFLRRIEEQADRLNDLILDMLSLARLDAGTDTFEHVPLAIGPVLRTCVENHRGRAEAKGLKLALRLDDADEGVCVLADEEAIRQILDNLIDNAIKYTPSEGRVRVQAKAEVERVLLEVSDTGIGIPREDLPRVFERFYRVDRARSRSLGGTGLGLAIVKHVVLSLGGQIRVESRLNGGSTFIVSLPRCPGSEGSGDRSTVLSEARGTGQNP